MEMTIKISFENDAFHTNLQGWSVPAPDGEVARILQGFVDGGLVATTLRDINGNAVGSVEID